MLPVAALLLVAGAPANDGAQRFVPFTPLTLRELYAKRLRFDRGVPRISVGIMDGQDAITVSAQTPLRLMFDEVDIPKVLYAPAGARFVLKPLKTKAAKLRYWVVVRARKTSDASSGEAIARAWKKRGLAVRTFEAGTIFALRGNVLDTREHHVAIGGFKTRAKAEALLAVVSKERQARNENEDAELFLHEELVAQPSGTIAIFDEAGVRHRARGSVYVGTIAGGKIAVDDVEFGRGYRLHGRERRAYRDDLYVVVDGQGKLALVNSVGAETLLDGLVPAEIFAAAPLEALKAQAVTARGEIFSKLAHRHFGDPFHLCSEQHCQVYAGATQEQPSTTRAVDETTGLLAVRPRASESDPVELVDSRYSSSCGGFTEANEIVWGTQPSASLRAKLDVLADDPALAPFGAGLDEGNVRGFLESYPPTACARASFTRADKYRWTRTFTSSEADSLASGLGVGRVTDVAVLGRGPGGRVTGVRVVGTRGSAEVLRELPVRRLFGNLNSGFFVVDVARGRDGELRSVRFTGGGWGHGVGMCQMGAISRAEHGHDFRRILSHYYNGATVVQIY